MKRFIFSLSMFLMFGGLQVQAQAFRVQIAAYNERQPEAFFTERGIASYTESADNSGIYITGYTFGAFPGFTNSSGAPYSFVRKYDSAGVAQWTRQFGSGVFDEALGIASDGAGVYVTGFTYGNLPGQTNAGGADAFVRKYDTAGTEQWTREFGTTVDERGIGEIPQAGGHLNDVLA